MHSATTFGIQNSVLRKVELLLQKIRYPEGRLDSDFSDLKSKRPTSTLKVSGMIVFWAAFRCFGLFFYLLLGFRQTLDLNPKDPQRPKGTSGRVTCKVAIPGGLGFRVEAGEPWQNASGLEPILEHLKSKMKTHTWRSIVLITYLVTVVIT